MKTYIVPVKYVFEGKLLVRAEDRKQALELAKNGLEVCSPRYASLDDDVQWQMDMIAERRYGRVTVATDKNTIRPKSDDVILRIKGGTL